MIKGLTDKRLIFIWGKMDSCWFQQSTARSDLGFNSVGLTAQWKNIYGRGSRQVTRDTSWRANAVIWVWDDAGLDQLNGEYCILIVMDTFLGSGVSLCLHSLVGNEHLNPLKLCWWQSTTLASRPVLHSAFIFNFSGLSDWVNTSLSLQWLVQQF